jgi:hypothetical protein
LLSLVACFVLDQSLNGEEQQENALGTPAFFSLVRSTPHRHEDPEFLESGGG